MTLRSGSLKQHGLPRSVHKDEPASSALAVNAMRERERERERGREVEKETERGRARRRERRLMPYTCRVLIKDSSTKAAF